MYHKTFNQLQQHFTLPSEIESRKWLSKRPFHTAEYYNQRIEKHLKNISNFCENWATTEGFEYEVWFNHRMILIYQQALDTLARLERGETVDFVEAY